MHALALFFVLACARAAAPPSVIVLVTGETRSMRMAAQTWEERLLAPLNARIGLCPVATPAYPDASLPRAILAELGAPGKRVVFEHVFDAINERDGNATSSLVVHACPSTCGGVTTDLPLPVRFKQQQHGNERSNLDQSRNLYWCYHALLAHEAAIGHRYSIVVRLRTDMALWRVLPKQRIVSLLPANATDPIAIFARHQMYDFSGVPDRFFVANHAGAEHALLAGLAAPRFYANGWSLAHLTGGHKFFCSVNLTTHRKNPEENTKNHLLVHHGRLLREYFMDYNSLIGAPSGCARYRYPGVIELLERDGINYDVFKVDPAYNCSLCCEW